MTPPERRGERLWHEEVVCFPPVGTHRKEYYDGESPQEIREQIADAADSVMLTELNTTVRRVNLRSSIAAVRWVRKR